MSSDKEDVAVFVVVGVLTEVAGLVVTVDEIVGTELVPVLFNPFLWINLFVFVFFGDSFIVFEGNCIVIN